MYVNVYVIFEIYISVHLWERWSQIYYIFGKGGAKAKEPEDII